MSWFRRRSTSGLLLASVLALVAGCDGQGGTTNVPANLRGQTLTFGQAPLVPAVVHIEQSYEVDGKARIRGVARSFDFRIYSEKLTKVGVPNAHTFVIAVQRDKTVSSVPAAGLFDVEDGPTWGAEIRRQDGEVRINGKPIGDGEDPGLAIDALETLDTWRESEDSTAKISGRTLAFGDTLRVTDRSGSIELRLIGLTEFRGKDHAVFATVGNATAVSADELGFGRLDADFRGETLVEIETGRVARVHSAGPMNMSVDTSSGSGRIKGTIDVDYTFRYER